MRTAISAAEVGAKCADWYSLMIARDIEKSIAIKQEISMLLSNMEQSDKVLAYYSLLEFRHQLLLEENQSHGNGPAIMTMSQSDPFLEFLFYFMNGQHEFYKNRFKAAIRLYVKAENLLEHVTDNYERAEFYQRIAEGYYHINQYTFAVSYLELALNIFKMDESYQEKVLYAELVLAAIDTEINRFTEAEARYQRIRKESIDRPFAHSLIVRGIGLNRLRQNLQEEAKEYMELALSIPDHASSVVGLKTKADLSFIKLRLGETGAIDLLAEAEQLACERGNIEYQARCLICRHLHVDFDQTKVDRGIQMLQEEELYFDAAEVCEEISRFYEKEGKYNLALNYMKIARDMNVLQFTLGSD
ncbi:response regulator aspartate phosphatase [Alkalicoccobacillus murimartini]|uniref:Response regulator aspartate phosphatase B n=1 Tax=Alkalicoccobacillus murimartini TaxID=171685 RepID=A0ABT9YDW9_9BACI|nr:modification methylase CeqI [Alkalicoccobacillus murimartini]MDQ0205392.1 response regulator aspartate phosphatase B [Alkalicoccobacillus murimartini]